MQLQFENKVILITGGAKGIGAAITRAVAEEGGIPVVIDRDKEAGKKIEEDLVNAGVTNKWIGADLSVTGKCRQAIATVAEKFGRIDGLVNTVGGWRGGKPVHETDPADWDFLFAVNLRTTLSCCRAVIPQMLRQGAGKIVNVSSRDGLSGGAGFAAYSASKSAVLRLTESLAAELKSSGINVNCIMPGTIDTPQNRKAMPNADFTKWVEPDAIAQVILFLLSDASQPINGAAIPVYGQG